MIESRSGSKNFASRHSFEENCNDHFSYTQNLFKLQTNIDKQHPIIRYI
jgi:hypothetical protein